LEKINKPVVVTLHTVLPNPDRNMLMIVKSIAKYAKGIVVMIKVDGTYLLPEILDKLRTGGITIKAVNLKKPSMDDVFVHYTGQELRDAETEKG